MTTILALAALVWCGLSVTSTPDEPPLLDLFAAVWPGLLAALVTAGVLALSGWRSDRRGLLPTGMILLTLVAVGACSALASMWATWRTVVEPAEDAFLQPGIMVSTSAPAASVLEVSLAVEMAVALGCVGLAVIGALRASGETGRP
ncbi:hypothetical protein [Micromonospora tulbaghiae]